MRLKTACIIQARMTSSRLPGKVLLPLPYGGSVTALEQVVRRAAACGRIDQVVVATTTNSEDDAVEALCRAKGLSCFRGSEHHVLERFWGAAKSVQADRIVRVTADCPCLDPAILDRVLMEHEREEADFTSSGIQRTFPIGIDQGVFSFEMLEEAYRNASHAHEREHVTPYFYKTHPQRYKIHIVAAKPEEHRPELRLTLDTRADYLMLCALYDQLYSRDALFPLPSILALLDQKGWIAGINAQTVQKRIYSSLEEELHALRAWADRQDLHRALAFLNAHTPDP